MERHARRYGFSALILTLLLYPTAARPQEAPPKPNAAHPARAVSSDGGAPLVRHDPAIPTVERAEQGGRLMGARKLLNAAIRDAEKYSPDNPRLSVLLIYLAGLDFDQGRYRDAIAVANRTLALDKKLYGPYSPRVTRDLNNLGMFNQAVGNDAAAEKDLKQDVSLARQNPGVRSRILLMALNNLSSFYITHKRPADAEPLLIEGLQLCEANPRVHATSCSGFRSELANLYRNQGDANAGEGMVSDAVVSDSSSPTQWGKKVIDLEALARQYEEDNSYDLAEETYRQALALIKKNVKPDDPLASQDLDLLGELLVKEGRNSEAEDLYKRALALQEQAVAKVKDSARSTAFSFDCLLNLYRTEGRLAELEPILLQALALQERVLGPRHEALAQTLLTLADVYQEEGKNADAEPVYQRALEIQEANLGPDDPHLIPTLNSYAELLQQLNESDQAKALFARAAALRQKLAAQDQK